MESLTEAAPTSVCLEAFSCWCSAAAEGTTTRKRPGKGEEERGDQGDKCMTYALRQMMNLKEQVDASDRAFRDLLAVEALKRAGPACSREHFLDTAQAMWRPATQTERMELPWNFTDDTYDKEVEDKLTQSIAQLVSRDGVAPP